MGLYGIRANFFSFGLLFGMKCYHLHEGYQASLRN